MKTMCQELPEVARYRFELTRDFALIKQIVTHPLIYPRMCDDFAPKPEDWQPFTEAVVRYLLAYDGDELLGMWVLIPQNVRCWAVHTCLLPNAYGQRSREAARAAIEWVFANTECVRLVTEVPLYNRLAKRFALDAGMKEYGLNPLAYQHEGRLWDIQLLGISKEGIN